MKGIIHQEGFREVNLRDPHGFRGWSPRKFSVQGTRTSPTPPGTYFVSNCASDPGGGGSYTQPQRSGLPTAARWRRFGPAFEVLPQFADLVRHGVNRGRDAHRRSRRLAATAI